MKLKYWFALPLLLATSAMCRSADAPAPADTPAPAITPPGSGPTPPPAVAPTPVSTPVTPPPQPSPITPAPAPAPIAPPHTTQPRAAINKDAAPISSSEQAGRTVTVKQSHVNVRGQPRINSDVVVRLNQGDAVVVLEEIKLPSPKTDEPAHWTKIALPSSAFVWVHSSFIDPATKTVKASRLNVRNGPGENFSVVGRIEKGAAIKELETKGPWIKIEPPSGSYGYVASHLLNHEAKTPNLAASKPVKPMENAKPTDATKPVEAATPSEPAATPKDSLTVATNAPSDLAATKAPISAEVTPATTNDASSATAESEPERAEKRIVTREGIVRRSVSIQAPTYFVLENKDNGKTINYLYSPANKLLLRDYQGQKILVTGEELLDERWPNTPVITVDKLRSMP